MDARSQLEAIKKLDLGPLSPEATQAFTLLFNLCEQLLAEQETLRAALAAKGPRRRGKGRGGKGGGKPPTNPVNATRPNSPVNRDHSSEAERRGTEQEREWKKTAKNDQLVIDREVLLAQIPDLPPDAVLIGYEDRIFQDLVLVRCNTRFRRARYHSQLTGKSYLAPLPAGYEGQFGPGIRTLALSLAYGANVSQPLLHGFFRQAGCSISKGQVCRLVTQGLQRFTAEAEAAIRAAVAQLSWLQADDTRSGVRTEHGCCHVLGNSLATYYKTTSQGNRRSVIAALFLGAPVVYRLDERAFDCLESWGVAQWVRHRLRALAAGAPSTEAKFEKWLDQRFPTLKPEPREQVLAAAALAGYHSQHTIPLVRRLLTDAASLFFGLVDEQALCWIHDARHYQKLVPVFAYQARALARFKKRYWQLYRDLLAYQRQPTEAQRTRLELAFDALVDERKAAPFLAECIARTRKNKAKLLLVLAHPELPLHNNAAELAVRRRVRKRNVSFGPVSEAGRQAWDTMQSLMGTAEKLGVSFWRYLEDRLHHTNTVPPLAELIRLKAQAAGLNSCSA
jgi:hypothetical protein